MCTRAIFALFLVYSAFSLGIAAPQCPANEIYNECGSACQATCKSPASILCKAICIADCFCKEGYLRNDDGACVPAAQCHGETLLEQPLAHPPPVMECEDNEIFSSCGSACYPTCKNRNRNRVCTRQCIIGCFCKEGYLRNEQGVCVRSETCGDVKPLDKTPIFAPICKDSNEAFQQCKACDATCDNPNPICHKTCVPGCACREGHVRGVDGSCMPIEACQKLGNETEYPEFMPGPVLWKPEPDPTFPKLPEDPEGPVAVFSSVRDAGQMQEPKRPKFLPGMARPRTEKEEKCPIREVFRSCGPACPSSCADPTPVVACTGHCVVGCFCEEGYLRNENGICVLVNECPL